MHATPRQPQATSLRCVGCGYDLSGSAVGGFCPECGRPVQDSLPRYGALQSAPHAVSSMVWGILSLVICPLLGIVAIALYYEARRAYQPTLHNAGSMTMARAGLIMGIISTTILVFWAGFALLGTIVR